MERIVSADKGWRCLRKAHLKQRAKFPFRIRRLRLNHDVGGCNICSQLVVERRRFAAPENTFRLPAPTSYDDKGYAVGSFLGNWYPQYSLLWREAEQEYQGLVDRYVELAVLAAAKRVREGGSGRIGRLGPEGLPRWKWITRLAENPRLRLPDR